MKVLFWNPRFWPAVGGMEVLAMQLLPALRRRGHELTLLTSLGFQSHPAEGEYQGIPVRRFDLLRVMHERDLAGQIRLRREVARFKRELRPDLVHFNFGGPDAYFHLATLKDAAAPSLLSLHSDLEVYPRGPGTMIGQMLRTAEWVTAVSNSTLQDALALAPEIAGRCSVVYNGLAPPALEPGPLPFDPPVLLCMGRLVEVKGFDVAVAAFVRVRERFPRAELWIAGDGPERQALERQAAASGAPVRFLGWVAPEEVPALLNRVTLVVIPSRWREPFGLVALEAAQMARPVVASRTGGLEETVAHGRTGLLVPPGDGAALAESVTALLEDPPLAASLGQAGRRQALDRFGLDACVSAYDQLYRRLGHV